MSPTRQRYTARQVKRALAPEQLLQRLDQGEDFEALCQELCLSLSRRSLPYLTYAVAIVKEALPGKRSLTTDTVTVTG